MLKLIKELGFNTQKFDNTTTAVLFRAIDRQHSCILLDEADNQELATTAAMRAVINSGHHTSGQVSRYLDGEVKTFSTFSPLALAAISKLPLPTLHRSVLLHMERAPDADLIRFDPKANPEQKANCTTIYNETYEWMLRCQLNLNPPMSDELRNRAADNWRVLIAVADACDPHWGTLARAAAVAMSAGQDDDLAVHLLSVIRDIFDQHPNPHSPDDA